MKIEFLTNQNFIVNKKNLINDNDYQIVAELISMIYQCHCFEVSIHIEDIKSIVKKEGLYLYKSGNDLQLKIKSLKNTLDIDFKILN